MKTGDSVRIELTEGETGHGTVVALEPLTIRVDNIPFDGPWNLFDTSLAKLMPILGAGFDDFYELTKLVERKYSMRSVVLYETAEQCKNIMAEIIAAGGAGECWTEPMPPKYRGMIGVAHTPVIKVGEIAKRHGGHIESTKVFAVPS